MSMNRAGEQVLHTITSQHNLRFNPDTPKPGLQRQPSFVDEGIDMSYDATHSPPASSMDSYTPQPNVSGIHPAIQQMYGPILNNLEKVYGMSHKMDLEYQEILKRRDLMRQAFSTEIQNNISAGRHAADLMHQAALMFDQRLAQLGSGLHTSPTPPQSPVSGFAHASLPTLPGGVTHVNHGRPTEYYVEIGNPHGSGGGHVAGSQHLTGGVPPSYQALDAMERGEAGIGKSPSRYVKNYKPAQAVRWNLPAKLDSSHLVNVPAELRNVPNSGHRRDAINDLLKLALEIEKAYSNGLTGDPGQLQRAVESLDKSIKELDGTSITNGRTSLYKDFDDSWKSKFIKPENKKAKKDHYAALIKWKDELSHFANQASGKLNDEGNMTYRNQVLRHYERQVDSLTQRFTEEVEESVEDILADHATHGDKQKTANLLKNDKKLFTNSLKAELDHLKRYFEESHPPNEDQDLLDSQIRITKAKLDETLNKPYEDAHVKLGLKADKMNADWGYGLAWAAMPVAAKAALGTVGLPFSTKLTAISALGLGFVKGTDAGNRLWQAAKSGDANAAVRNFSEMTKSGADYAGDWYDWASKKAGLLPDRPATYKNFSRTYRAEQPVTNQWADIKPSRDSLSDDLSTLERLVPFKTLNRGTSQQIMAIKEAMKKDTHDKATLINDLNTLRNGITNVVSALDSTNAPGVLSRNVANKKQAMENINKLLTKGKPDANGELKPLPLQEERQYRGILKAADVVDTIDTLRSELNS